MNKTEITCDMCGLLIDGETRPARDQNLAGGGEHCSLSYRGTMGHNQVPWGGWDFHYQCFSQVVRNINALCVKPGDL